jgi:flagellar hook-basal body complex protein FliE
MKSAWIFLCLAPALVDVQAGPNPLAKVFQLIDGLKQTINDDAEKADAAYRKFAEYCGTTARNVQHELETSARSQNKLESKVKKLSSDIELGDTKIKDFTAAIAKAESELQGATAIRKKEAEEFVEGEKQLMGTVDTLERALSELEKQLSSGKSFAQLDDTTLASLMQTLSIVDDAAAMPGSSMEALSSLVQAHEEDGDGDMGAPSASAYKKQSGGIMDMLEDMRDKAEGQLQDLRNTETKAKNSYQLLRQGLEDEIKAAKKELAEEKSGKAEAGEEKASATGNLEVTDKEGKAAGEKKDEVQSNCLTAASDHEANVASRKEELKVIEEAEKILRESTGGAEEKVYSLLQIRASSGSSQRAKARQLTASSVIKNIQNLAKQQHSGSLAQLASRIAAELRYSAVRHGDPFKNIKSMIANMVSKLEKEASEEATEKAYCDEELAKTKTKQGELEDGVTKLDAKIGKAASNSAALKEEVAEIMSELSALTKEQATMDSVRREESASYQATKKDLEAGLGGVRKALSVLRDYYGSSSSAALLQSDDADSDEMSSLMQQAVKQPSPPEKAEKKTGAGAGIIQLLELCESDLAKNLASEDAEESDAQSTYEKQTQTNKINKAQKEQDSKYKTQEFKGLDKSIAELQADEATETDELNAVNQYYGKVKERCIAKPTSYEELKARRDAEIQGLKEALASVESQALMQVGARRHRGSLRGDSLRTEGGTA